MIINPSIPLSLVALAIMLWVAFKHFTGDGVVSNRQKSIQPRPNEGSNEVAGNPFDKCTPELERKLWRRVKRELKNLARVPANTPPIHAVPARGAGTPLATLLIQNGSLERL